MGREVRAARVHKHGKPLSIEQVEIAEPSHDEVIVDLAYAGVNPVDRYVALGRVAGDQPLPRTIGGEASGWLDGKPVVVTGEGLGSTRDGVYASAVVCPRSALTDLPPDIDMAAAASAGIAGLTAVNIVNHTAEVTRKDRVLVLGAGGGVGLLVVQLVASLGAQVWGQIGTASKASSVQDAGAQKVITGGPESIAEAEQLSPTVVFDPLGAGFTPAALAILAERGRLVSFGTSAGSEVTLQMQPLYRNTQRILGYAGMRLSSEERRRGMAEVVSLMSEGLLIPPLTKVPLHGVNDAFESLAQREVTGKVVLDLKA